MEGKFVIDIFNPNVYIHISKNYSYPAPPFNPPKIYPEFVKVKNQDVDKTNEIYDKVRQVLVGLKLDTRNYGTTNWNPFKELVSKGDHVVIKPNLVRAQHPLGFDPISMVTHGSLIRPIIDYVLLATEGDCKISICDVPLQQSSWTELMKVTGINKLHKFYLKKKVNIHLLDLRKEISIENKSGVIIKRIIKDRDPLGYSIVNIGEYSSLMPVMKNYKKFEITDYGTGTVQPHHNPDTNEYFISKTILDSDVFINVPKLKTHRKAGLTCALKNIIGINGDKCWLAHHRKGSKYSGGDEYRTIHNVNQVVLLLKWRVFAFLKRHKSLLPFATFLKFVFSKIIPRIIKVAYVPKKLFSKKGAAKNHPLADSVAKDANDASLSEGSWYGNDTIWRVILDLNRILIYVDKEGKFHKTPQRKYFGIVDAIIAGEKEGPLEPTPKHCGAIMGGFNPVAIDFASSEIMGFDWRKIPSIREAFKLNKFPLTSFSHNQINIQSNYTKINFQFTPSKGWMGHIEKND